MSTATIKMTGVQTITLTPNDGVMALSIQSDVTGGSFNFTGSRPFQGIPSETITLTDGLGVNLTSSNPQNPIEGCTISWNSGIVNVLISFLM